MNPFQGLGQRKSIRTGDIAANREVLLRRKPGPRLPEPQEEDPPRPKLTKVIEVFVLRGTSLNRQAAYVIDFYSLEK